MVFGFCGTGTLACAVEKEQVLCRRLSAVQQDALSPQLSSLSEPAGAGVPDRAVFCAGWGARPAHDKEGKRWVRIFGFVAQGTLACAVGKEQVSFGRLFSRAARCPLIPLSSLSEPAGAGPEFARVGEPRASRKDDSDRILIVPAGLQSRILGQFHPCSATFQPCHALHASRHLARCVGGFCILNQS